GLGVGFCRTAAGPLKVAIRHRTSRAGSGDPDASERRSGAFIERHTMGVFTKLIKSFSKGQIPSVPSAGGRALLRAECPPPARGLPESAEIHQWVWRGQIRR